MIKEIIVVEGRDDIAAVKNAVEAEVIATGGFGFDRKFIENLKKIAEKRVKTPKVDYFLLEQ